MRRMLMGLKKNFILFLAVWLFSNLAMSLYPEEKDDSFEEVLIQAEYFLQSREYEKAIQFFLKAIPLTDNILNLSRVYFGLSLSYFMSEDLDKSREWLQRVLEIDAEKEISPLFYPQQFVDFFFEEKEKIKKEKMMKSSLKGESPPSPVSSPPAQEVVGPSPKFSYEGGKWEVEVHCGSWSFDIFKGLFEERLIEEVSEEIGKKVSGKVRESHPALISTTGEQSFVLDTGGSNYGIEMRFFPHGEKRSFSLGLSLEKTNLRFTLKGPFKQRFADGTYADVETDAYLRLSPLTTNLSFRWEIKPNWKVTPYFVLGAGIASLKGEVHYEFSGNYNWLGPQEEIESSETKSFKEAEEEADFNIPNIFLLFQLNLGVRAEIFHPLILRGEVGFWDGLLLRVGLALRF